MSRIAAPSLSHVYLISCIRNGSHQVRETAVFGGFPHLRSSTSVMFHSCRCCLVFLQRSILQKIYNSHRHFHSHCGRDMGQSALVSRTLSFVPFTVSVCHVALGLLRSKGTTYICRVESGTTTGGGEFLADLSYSTIRTVEKYLRPSLQ